MWHSKFLDLKAVTNSKTERGSGHQMAFENANTYWRTGEEARGYLETLTNTGRTLDGA